MESSDEMEIQEITMPLSLDDFEVGDRVYVVGSNNDSLEFGTIKDIYNPHMNVLMDNGKMPLVHINQFKDGGPIGKCFPVGQLNVGSVISFPYGAGKRFYADITDYVPGKYVELTYRKGKTKSALITAEEGRPLEFQLAFYTLEG